jgi:hypothetical protein
VVARASAGAGKSFNQSDKSPDLPDGEAGFVPDISNITVTFLLLQPDVDLKLLPSVAELSASSCSLFRFITLDHLSKLHQL